MADQVQERDTTCRTSMLPIPPPEPELPTSAPHHHPSLALPPFLSCTVLNVLHRAFSSVLAHLQSIPTSGPGDNVSQHVTKLSPCASQRICESMHQGSRCFTGARRGEDLDHSSHHLSFWSNLLTLGHKQIWWNKGQSCPRYFLCLFGGCHVHSLEFAQVYHACIRCGLTVLRDAK